MAPNNRHAVDIGGHLQEADGRQIDGGERIEEITDVVLVVGARGGSGLFCSTNPSTGNRMKNREGVAIGTRFRLAAVKKTGSRSKADRHFLTECGKWGYRKPSISL